MAEPPSAFDTAPSAEGAGAVRRIVGMLEDPRIPFAYHVGTFAAAFAIRMLLETVSVGAHRTTIAQVSHYALFYVSLALWFMLLLRLLTGETMDRIARIVLPGFIVIPIVPLLDLLISGGTGAQITYLLPGRHDDLLNRFLTFYGSYNGSAASYGMRIEIGIALLAAGLYCRHKTGRMVVCILAAVGVYTVVFLHSIALFGLRWVGETLGVPCEPTDTMLLATYLLSFLCSGTAVAVSAWPSVVRAMVSDNRLPRITHYLLMMGAGFVIAGRLHPDVPTLEQLLLRFLAVAAVFLACHSAMIANNLADVEIDRISNKDRPLVTGEVDTAAYARAGGILGVLAVAYALVIGPRPLLAIVAFLGSCFVYSMPPLRLKRIPVASKFFIALNSYALFLLGVHLGNVSWRGLAHWYLPFFLVGFTLAVNFIDLKDVEGDRREGIATLPVLLGDARAKVLIGLFFAGTYLSLHLVFLDMRLLIALVFVSLVMFLLITRRKYNEGPVFALYLASVVGLILYLAVCAPVVKLVGPASEPRASQEMSSAAPGYTVEQGLWIKER